MSLNKYIENRLVNNDKAAVFLEFNKDTDKIKDLGSQNLIKTVKSLKKKGIKIPRKNSLNNERIKSIDHRDYFFKSCRFDEMKVKTLKYPMS
jgi:phage FluMu protein Com